MAERRRRYFNLIDSGETPPAQATAAEPAATVGWLLQQRRLELGQDLEFVARMLRIRRSYLEAIETDRYADLPGSAYVTGFLRSYAEHLGLDSHAVLARFKEEEAGTVKHAELYFPEPVSEGRVPGGMLIIVGVVLAVIAYGSWFALSDGNERAATDVPSLPERLVGLIYGRPPEPPAAAPTTALPASEMTALLDSARDASVNASPAPAPAPGTAPAAGQPVPAPAEAAPAATAGEGAEEAEVPQLPDLEEAAAAPGAAAPAAQPEGPRTYGEEGPARVVIRAAEESWIQVRDAGGKVLMSRLMRAGDVYRVPNIPGLRLRTGNAGGTVVSVDGKDLPPLGEAKQVLSDVPLDPAGLQAR